MRTLSLVCGWLLWARIVVLAQVPATASGDSLPHFRQHNQLEAYLYYTVDQGLRQDERARNAYFENAYRHLWRIRSTPDERLAEVILLCHWGYSLARTGNLQEAVTRYETARRVYTIDRSNRWDITEYCLKPLGNHYTRLGDYTRAANVIRAYWYDAEQQHQPHHVLAALQNLAIVYEYTGHANDARGLLTRALTYTSTQDAKAKIYLSQSRLLLQQGNETATDSCLRIAQTLLTSRADTPTQLSLYQLQATLAMRHERWSDAEKLQALAWEKARQTPETTPRDQARIRMMGAAIKLAQGQARAARAEYYQGLSLLLPVTQTLPDDNLLYPEVVLKELLDGLAAVYETAGEATMALACYRKSLVVEDLLANLYPDDQSRWQQQLEVRARLSKMLRLLYAEYIKSGDVHWAEQAFQLTERTRAAALWKMQQQHQWINRLPEDSPYVAWQQAQQTLAQITTALAVERARGTRARPALLHALTTQQHEQQLKVKTWEDQWQKQFPSVYPSQADINLAQLSSRLKHDRATLIEFVAGAPFYYQFIVDGRGISFRQLSNGDSIRLLAKNLYHAISTPVFTDSLAAQYLQEGHTLYQQLQLDQVVGARHWVIIPDGWLSLIPFECLLTASSTSMNVATWPYLIHQHTISYATSMPMYLHENNASTSWHNVLGIFPVFDQTDQALTHSLSEARALQKAMPGLYLFHGQASRSAFEQHAHNYPLIHLSTHAAAGDDILPPMIHFRDTMLYLPEIQTLNIQPDLLVLSACETGVGTLVNGEGAMSLARAFQVAGANNIIFSQWRINDESTATLMAGFYKAYQRSGHRAEALAEAKRHYLAQSTVKGMRKSPYYWAGFVYYGNLHHHTTYAAAHVMQMLILSFVAVLAFSILLYIIRRRRRQSSL